jgi:DNA polymerase-4
MIAYLQLPLQTFLIGRTDIFLQLRGIAGVEMDTPRSAYISLESWMTAPRIRELYQALRHTYGAHIRFGAAEQKTTARAAALYRAVPHCTIVTPAMTEAFLAELPIRLLPGLGERTTRYLEKHGITTFAAFRNLSYQTLREWFGVSGLILQQFARGIDPRPVEQRSYASLA